MENRPRTNKVRKVLSYYKPYRFLFFADLFTALFTTAVGLSIPLFTRYVAQYIQNGRLAEEGSVSYLLGIGGVMLVLIILGTAACIFYDHMGHVMGARMERDMRSELFAHMQKLPLSFFDNHKTGELMSRITNDILNLAEVFHHGPEDLILYLASFIAAFVILIRIHVGLALVICAILPIMLVYSLFFGKRLNKAYKNSRENISKVSAQLEDSLSGIKVVKSFANEALESEKFEVLNEVFLQGRKDIYKYEARYYSAMMPFFSQVITVLVVVLGGIWVSAGSVSISDLIAFILYVGYLTAPIPQLARVYQQYQDGSAGFSRFLEILETPCEEYEPENKETEQSGISKEKSDPTLNYEQTKGTVKSIEQKEPAIENEKQITRYDNITGDIRFSNVSFQYAEEQEFVLKDLNLHVAPGTYVAIVGPSGVGKTTLCSLIPRLYQVCGGEVLLDGVNVEEIPLKILREHIGLVEQDVYLFAGTVFENIMYGRPSASREDVINAAKQANAHSFISELSNGYDSDIGQRGTKLSGGQRQRLSIARVFLKNPEILIFDEATSALDQESERVIYDSLTTLSQNRTTFVIAHRLSTIRNAERIIVLTKQGIAEQGTHAKLIDKNGVYAGLYKTLL